MLWDSLKIVLKNSNIILAQKLKTNKYIIKKPTDEGGGLVLMDKRYYRDHLVDKEHLHNNVHKDVPLDSGRKV